ncbi:MAG: TolC family protein [Desulfomonilaceae bacterium]
MRLSIFVRRSVISLLGVLALSLSVAYAQTPNVCVSKSANNERGRQGLGAAYSQTQNGLAYPIDLQTTLRLAGAQNLDIRIARSELQKARANQLMAWEQFLPWLSTGAVFERRDGLSFSSGNGAINEAHYGYNLPGFTVVGRVPVGDAIFNALSARQLVRASGNALNAQWQNSSLAAAMSYFDTLEAKARANVERQAAAISATYQKELHHAVVTGIAFKGDELRIQTETERYQIAVRLWLQHQRDASAKLADILRMDSTIDLVPEDSDLMPIMLFDTQAPLESLVQQAYSARPELRESQALIAAANAQRKGVTYGPIIPTLSTAMFFGSLNGGWGNYWGERAIDTAGPITGPHTRGYVQQYPGGQNGGATQDILFGVNWRIGPGGLGDVGAIRVANARLNTEQLRGQKMLDEVTRQVVQSFTRVRSYYDQIALARRNISSARETLRLTEGRKDYGVGNVLEVIQAQQALERASTEYVVAMAEFNKAQYELSRAVGGLLPGNAR